MRRKSKKRLYIHPKWLNYKYDYKTWSGKLSKCIGCTYTADGKQYGTVERNGNSDWTVDSWIGKHGNPIGRYKRRWQAKLALLKEVQLAPIQEVMDD